MSKTKIEESFSANYGPIVLWWDDVAEIVEILHDGDRAVDLNTKRYKFSTLDAAKEHFGDMPQYDLTFSASRPYTSLTAGRLYIGSGPHSAQMFIELDRILKKRERRPRWLFKFPLFLILSFLLGAVYALPIDAPVKWATLILHLTLTATYAWTAFISIKRELVVYPIKKTQARGFLHRNKDQLLMHIITLVLGAAIGFAGAQVKERFLAPTGPASQK